MGKNVFLTCNPWQHTSWVETMNSDHNCDPTKNRFNIYHSVRAPEADITDGRTDGQRGPGLP